MTPPTGIEHDISLLAASTAAGSAEGLADALTAAVIAWTGGAAQDDATLIIVERAPIGQTV